MSRPTRFLFFSDTCPAGAFGDHCEINCHCSDQLPCNRKTGVCKTPVCEPGWRGPACHIGKISLWVLVHPDMANACVRVCVCVLKRY